MEVIIDTNFGMALGPTSGETLLEFSDSPLMGTRERAAFMSKELTFNKFRGDCSTIYFDKR